MHLLGIQDFCMEEAGENRISSMERLRRAPVFGMFFETAFIHYAWTGAFISALNIFLLWVLIDRLHIETVVASTGIVGGTFVLRYMLFRSLDIV
jgi:hypothetical protein